jgi:hypothetical protein
VAAIAKGEAPIGAVNAEHWAHERLPDGGYDRV